MSELNLEEIESRANATPTKEQLAEMFRNFSEYPNQDAEMYSAMLRSRTASAEQVKALIAEVRRLRAQIERVRELHKLASHDIGFIETYCEECHEAPDCPTIQALGDDNESTGKH